MGKRSEFDRIEKDYYRTFDLRAGKALKPHLPQQYTYAEPFCGRGDLINQLSGQCLYASDIQPDYEFNTTGLDFIEKDFTQVCMNDINACDYIITNPPWSRPLLHSSIEHFANMKPTWLLFDSDWSNTKQAEPFLNKYCKKIVAVGRMKWIENSPTAGKDNVSWYLFTPNKNDNIIEFYGIVSKK